MSAPTMRLLATALLLVAARLSAQDTRPGASGFEALDARGRLAPALATHVTLSVDALPLRAVVDSIARRAGFGFVADGTLPGLDRRVSLHVRDVTAAAALERALAGSSIAAMVTPSGQVVLVAASDAAPRPTTTYALRGLVRDAETRVPIDGARVEVPALHRAAVARETGRFELPVPAGTHTLRVTRLGYRPVELAASADGSSLDVVMTRASIPLASVVVTPGTFGMMQQTVAASRTFSRTQIESVPQIGEDIYRAVNRLPGVAADDFSSDFRVRGAPGSELYTTLDGVELVHPFHLQDLGGAFSILDVQAIGGVDLTTGGASAEVGDRLAGALAMRSREPRTDGVHGSVGVSLMNARAMSQGGFGGGRGAWLASTRRGYLDLALRIAGASDSLSPRYGDTFLKVQYDLPERWSLGGRVAAHVLRADDRLRYLDDDGRIESRYGSDYAWLTWDGRVGHATTGDEPRLAQTTVLSATHVTHRRAGDVHDQVSGRGTIGEDRAFTALGVRQDWRLGLSPRALLRWGVDVREERARYDYDVEHARDTAGTLRADGTRPVVTYTEAAHVHMRPAGTRTGGYVSQRLRPVDALTIELGVRADRNGATDDAAVLPRVNVAWEARAGTTVRAAWGRASQSQSLATLVVEDGDSALTPAKRAVHRVLGVEQRLPLGIVARVEGYVRDQSALWPYALNTTNDPPLVSELEWDHVRVHPSEGRARGIELFARREAGTHADWSASYALAESRERVGGVWIPGQADQRHAVNVDVSVHPRDPRWRLSGALSWHSGWPFTPAVVRVDTLARTDRTLSILGFWTSGALSSQRLPAYRRVDLRWTRYVGSGRHRGSVFLEVYNLLGTQNARGYFTNVNGDGRGHVVLTSEVNSSLPRLPAIGASWEF